MRHRLQAYLTSRVPAFSLMEAALVLAIAGLALTAVLPLITLQRGHQKIATTEGSLNKVVATLEKFHAQYKRYPCPSATRESHQDFGLALATCAQHHEGIVPFRSLGLSAHDAQDGYGSWLTYAVSPRHTMEGSHSGAPAPKIQASGLSGAALLAGLRQSTGAPAASAGAVAQDDSPELQVLWHKGGGGTVPATDSAATETVYIVISHGSQRYGAHTGRGTRYRGADTSPLMEENANGDRTYVEGRPSEQPYFDHSLQRGNHVRLIK